MNRRAARRRAGHVALAIAFSPTLLVGCARSELDICIDHLSNIGEKRQLPGVVEARCAEAVEQNGGKSPF